MKYVGRTLCVGVLLSSSLSWSLCFPHVSVPQRDHQKHPRGRGDPHLWPPVLSTGGHCLGHQGSRDPHGLSERGEHFMSHASERCNQAVRCRRWRKWVDCFLPVEEQQLWAGAAFPFTPSSCCCVVCVVCVFCRLSSLGWTSLWAAGSLFMPWLAYKVPVWRVISTPSHVPPKSTCCFT